MASIPADDPTRQLTVVDRDTPGVAQLFLAGNTYSMLITAEQTNGTYCLIDMHIPDGGGPPPHRHNFEEMFTVLEGEITFTFRGEERVVSAGSTVNIPANAPHFFRNRSGRDARMLCMCSPAGQDGYFLRVGDLLQTRTAPPPELSDDDMADRRRRAGELAPQYETELLG
jgi:quercetin dioxygenase-like cupin family protein